MADLRPSDDGQTAAMAPDLEAEVALLDLDATIVAVNESWLRFCQENGGDPATCGVGANYLAVCAPLIGDPTVDGVAAALAEALGGDRPGVFRIQIPCHAPDANRWFDLTVSSRTDDRGERVGATVIVSPIPARSSDPSPEADASPVGPALEQFRRVALVARALTADLELEEVVGIVVRQGMAGLDADGGTLAVLDGRRLRPVAVLDTLRPAVAALGPLTLDRQLPMTIAARERHAVYASSRLEGELRFPDLAAASPSSQAFAALPLEADGELIGALGITFQRSRSFSEADRLFLRALADLTALALAARFDEVASGSRTVRPAAMGNVGLIDAAVEGAPDGILVCDAEGHIVLANRRLGELLGHQRDDLLAHPVEVLVPLAARAVHRAYRHDYEADPSPRPMGRGRRFNALASDGREVPVEVGLSPIYADGSTYTVAVVRLADQAEPTALRPAEALAADLASATATATAADVRERVIRRLFGSGLTLAAMINRLQLSAVERSRLHEVIDQLDAAMLDIRANDRGA